VIYINTDFVVEMKFTFCKQANDKCRKHNKKTKKLKFILTISVKCVVGF